MVQVIQRECGRKGGKKGEIGSSEINVSDVLGG